MSQNTVVGIDVSKDKVNVCCLPEDECFEVKAEDYGGLVERLVRLKPRLVVMEATGGYERPLFSGLADAGLPVAVVNPRRVKEFARAGGRRAKTDALDARLIAEFGQTMEPTPNQYAGDESLKIRDILTRRRQLVEMRASEECRLKKCPPLEVMNGLKKTIGLFKRLIDDLDHQLDRHIQESPELRENEEILKSVPGVGDQTARTLLFWLPELGSIGRSKICALAGLAPMNRDSGKHFGVRYIQGGRPTVRKALYLACITAIRRHPRISLFYRRLRDSGKKAKVAIVACARKMLVCLNTMMRTRQKFDANYL